MTGVLGRSTGDGATARSGGRGPDGGSSGDGASGRLGRYLARDGSAGAPVDLDMESPHVALVVGKRGSGKSYTLGVLAEELGATRGVTGVVVDPMGVFAGLAQGGNAGVVREPRVPAASLPPRAWPSLLGLDPAGSPGALVWQAAADASSLAGLRDAVADAAVEESTRRAALNHLDLAGTWDVFEPDGLRPGDLLTERVTVLDCAGLGGPATNAVVRVLASGLYRRAVAERVSPVPWLLVDEAHVALDGVAGPALRTLLTRGRQPGVSLVLATQRPSALPDVAVSQADLLVAHRLTAEADLAALSRARPTYLEESIADRVPVRPGEALVVDDASETATTVRVRERRTPHGGGSPRASDRVDAGRSRPDRNGPSTREAMGPGTAGSSRGHSERTE